MSLLRWLRSCSPVRRCVVCRVWCWRPVAGRCEPCVKACLALLSDRLLAQLAEMEDGR